jgi:hypothetical protein
MKPHQAQKGDTSAGASQFVNFKDSDILLFLFLVYVTMS